VREGREKEPWLMHKLVNLPPDNQELPIYIWSNMYWKYCGEVLEGISWKQYLQ
jgi:hypothetical protein